MLGFAGISLLAWVASASVAAANLHGWFAALNPPALVPSNAMLAHIWGILAAGYLAIGLAAWLLWRQPLAASWQRKALNLWGWQLALGAAWPAAFFGLHLLLTAAVLAALLVAVAGLTLRRFAVQDKTAGVLLIPYFAFTISAFYLNLGFWWLNH